MPEFATSVTVWFKAEDDSEAMRQATALGELLTGLDAVIQVEVVAPEDVS